MRHADAIARWVYERTGYSESAPPGPIELLRRLVGDAAIHFANGPLWVLRLACGSTHVLVPCGLPPERLCLCLGIAVAQTATLVVAPERAADRAWLAKAAISVVMPASAVRRAAKALGGCPSPELIGRAFVVPEPIAAVRLRSLRLARGHVRPDWRDVG